LIETAIAVSIRDSPKRRTAPAGTGADVVVVVDGSVVVVVVVGEDVVVVVDGSVVVVVVVGEDVVVVVDCDVVVVDAEVVVVDSEVVVVVAAWEVDVVVELPEVVGDPNRMSKEVDPKLVG